MVIFVVFVFTYSNYFFLKYVHDLLLVLVKNDILPVISRKSRLDIWFEFFSLLRNTFVCSWACYFLIAICIIERLTVSFFCLSHLEWRSSPLLWFLFWIIFRSKQKILGMSLVLFYLYYMSFINIITKPESNKFDIIWEKNRLPEYPFLE